MKSFKTLFFVVDDNNYMSSSKNNKKKSFSLKTKRSSLESNRSTNSVDIVMSEYEIVENILNEQNKTNEKESFLLFNSNIELQHAINDEEDSVTSILNCRKARRSLESIDLENSTQHLRNEDNSNSNNNNPPTQRTSRLRRRNACEELDALV